MRALTVSGPGGRALAVLVAGAEDGVPMLVHHGTPGSRLVWPELAADAERRGLALVSYDRPGYGGSARHPGRTVADAATDVAAIADAIAAPRVATFGYSGGGPHALACAALLPDRVAAAASVAGVAPFEASGLNWLAGMGADNLAEFGAALQGEPALRSWLERAAAALADTTADHLVDALASLISEVDRAALTPAVGEFVLGCIRTGLAAGVDGWLDDDLAFLRPWGFELGSIGVPTLITHGEQDRFVPFAHGEWLAKNIPAAQQRLESGDGHVSLAIGKAVSVQAWLADRLD